MDLPFHSNIKKSMRLYNTQNNKAEYGVVNNLNFYKKPPHWTTNLREENYF
jgi:hypothetical protein